MSEHQVTCGNCYQAVQFSINDLELRPRPASSDYPNGFLMIKCSHCDFFNPPSGMLDYKPMLKEWLSIKNNQSKGSR